jgi:hypothetical protein
MRTLYLKICRRHQRCIYNRKYSSTGCGEVELGLSLPVHDIELQNTCTVYKLNLF